MATNFKRIGTDIAGYFLILLGIGIGWLPGPGGIPLVVAGLGLLSIHNAWAQKLRDYALQHGGKMIRILFPANRLIELLYDLVVVIILILVTVLAWQHAAIWEKSLAIALFFVALFIALMNRQRLERLRARRK